MVNMLLPGKYSDIERCLPVYMIFYAHRVLIEQARHEPTRMITGCLRLARELEKSIWNQWSLRSQSHSQVLFLHIS